MFHAYYTDAIVHPWGYIIDLHGDGTVYDTHIPLGYRR